MQSTPRGNRLHIAVFGRRNAGKSSLINALAGQAVALVSDVPGTTTDPVYKGIEWSGLGPVCLIDTAGIDDEGELGDMRVRKTKEVVERTDLALLLIPGGAGDCELELQWAEMLRSKRVPIIGVVSRADEGVGDVAGRLREFSGTPVIEVSAKKMLNIGKLKEEIRSRAPKEFEQPTLLGDLVQPGELVVLVAPQDPQAPKGRLILPQVQAIRDILDHHACALTVTENELELALSALHRKPDLVVTDSQVFRQVNAVVPPDVPLTSFSILMARFKGDYATLLSGAKAIDGLCPGDSVLIAEACSHHAQHGDISREKLPAWLETFVGGKLDIAVYAGNDYPGDLSRFKLVVHCGACMFNRKQMLSRIAQCKDAGVPITNFGMAIAHMNGMLERVAIGE
jgi:[FeFe] hydrogenase H-cluster maturation GTPase HydF